MRQIRVREPATRTTRVSLVVLCGGSAVFGIFFFLTVFTWAVWGYSALRTGLARLPLTARITVASGAAARLMPELVEDAS
jgi:hypothetical protein